MIVFFLVKRWIGLNGKSYSSKRENCFYICYHYSRTFWGPEVWVYLYIIHCTKMKFSVKAFLSKSDQIRRFLRIWSHLLKKSLMKNFIFRAVSGNFNILLHQIKLNLRCRFRKLIFTLIYINIYLKVRSNFSTKGTSNRVHF